MKEIKCVSIEDIHKETNKLADSLSMLAFGSAHLWKVQFMERSLYSVIESKEWFNIEKRVKWMKTIYDNLTIETLSKFEVQATKYDILH